MFWFEMTIWSSFFNNTRLQFSNGFFNGNSDSLMAKLQPVLTSTSHGNIPDTSLLPGTYIHVSSDQKRVIHKQCASLTLSHRHLSVRQSPHRLTNLSDSPLISVFSESMSQLGHPLSSLFGRTLSYFISECSATPGHHAITPTVSKSMVCGCPHINCNIRCVSRI